MGVTQLTIEFLRGYLVEEAGGLVPSAFAPLRATGGTSDTSIARKSWT